jgi:hypothetical protein
MLPMCIQPSHIHIPVNSTLKMKEAGSFEIEKLVPTYKPTALYPRSYILFHNHFLVTQLPYF